MSKPNFKSKAKKKGAARGSTPDWHESKLADFKAAVLDGKDNAALSEQFPKPGTTSRGTAGLNAKRYALAQAIVSILPDPRDERCLHAISMATSVPVELIKNPTPEAAGGYFTELATHRKPVSNDLIKKFVDVAIIPTASSAKVVKEEEPVADDLLEPIADSNEFEFDIDDPADPPKPKAPVKTEVKPEPEPKTEVKDFAETREEMLKLAIPIPPKRTYEPPVVHPRLLYVSDKDAVSKLEDLGRKFDSLEKKLEDLGRKFDLLVEQQMLTNKHLQSK